MERRTGADSLGCSTRTLCMGHHMLDRVSPNYCFEAMRRHATLDLLKSNDQDIRREGQQIMRLDDRSDSVIFLVFSPLRDVSLILNGFPLSP